MVLASNLILLTRIKIVISTVTRISKKKIPMNEIKIAAVIVSIDPSVSLTICKKAL